MRRRLAALASLCLLALPGPAVAQERLLRVVSPWEITSLEPSRAGYVFTRMEVAETLAGADDGGLPTPGLAASWQVSGDGLVWRFVLREGARFHDGTAVSAEAVVASLERARANPGVLGNAPITALAALSGAVEIRLSRPFVALPAFLAHSSTQILAPASVDGEGRVRAVIGSGPYRIAAIEMPQRMEVARAETWAGAPPAIARASLLAAGRGETRAVLAESGQADLVYTLDPASLERLRRNPRITVLAVPIPRTITVKLNAGDPLLADVRARRAISDAIDRAGIARAILRNPEAAATQLFPPTLSEWHVPALAPLGHDPGAARASLAALGWQPGPDGVRMRDGIPFRLTLRTFPDRPELPTIAAALQDQLRQVGIAVSVSVGNSSEIPAGHRDGTLQMALFARNFSLVPDPIGTMLADFGPRGGDWGAMGWSSSEMARALDRLSGTTDPAERARLRGEIAAILQAELPVVPIGWYEHTLAASRRLAGVTLDPLELSYRISAMRWAE
jgi:peptide/nickel transport system substrate-binding protein